MERIIVDSGIMTARCYRVFFDQMNFFDTTCLKLLVSKALGYMVITGSVGVKVPQILSIVRAGSVAGISLTMFLLELVGLTISLGYNYLHGNPFSTWGETFFLLLQTAIIVALMLHYSKTIGLKSLAAAGLWVAVLAAIGTRQISAAQMAVVQPVPIALFVMSKVPQVIRNFKEKSTGKLAFLTFFLNTAGGAARIFTTIQEVPDVQVLTSVLIGFALNLTITLQIIFFGDKEAQLTAQTSKNNSSSPSIESTGRSGVIELSRHRVASDAADHKPNTIVSSQTSHSNIINSPPSMVPILENNDSDDSHAITSDSSDLSEIDTSDEATTDETTSMPSSSPRVNTASFSAIEDAVTHSTSNSSRNKIAKLLGEDPGSTGNEESVHALSKKDKKDKKEKKDKKAEKELKEKEKKFKKDRKKAEKEEEKRKKKPKD
jgi:mannose-P-dolichol utilization defect protein 1